MNSTPQLALPRPGLPASTGDAPRSLAGICFLLVGLGVFAMQDVVVKNLSPHYPVWEIVFVRSVVTLLIVTPLLALRLGSAGFRTGRLGLHVLRGSLAFLSYTLYFLAIAALPLADVAALYASAPLFLTLVCIPILGEKVGLRRGVAVMIGFLGVMVMLQPGSGVFNSAGLPAVGAAFLYACNASLTRRMGTTERPMLLTLTSSFVYMTGAGVVSLILLMVDLPLTGSPTLDFIARPWTLPGAEHLGLMALTGVIAAVGFICLTQAYLLTPVSLAAPFEYSYLLWASLFGYVFFNQLPGPVTVLGASIVVASGLFVVFREQHLARIARWVRRARVPVGGPPGVAR